MSKISKQKIDDIFFSILFPLKIGIDISCKLSPQETICMKCQSLFSREKYFIMLSQLESVGLIPGRCIPNTLKMVLAALFLGNQH